MSVIAVVAVVWAACAFFAAGAFIADFRWCYDHRWRSIDSYDQRREALSFAIGLAMLGPLAMFAALMSTGFLQHGWTLSMGLPREQRKGLKGA